MTKFWLGGRIIFRNKVCGSGMVVGGGWWVVGGGWWLVGGKYCDNFATPVFRGRDIYEYAKSCIQDIL